MDRDDSNVLGLYKELRAEILQADAQNYQVLGFVVAASAALITAGVGQDRPADRAVVFGLVYLVTWPCQRLLQGNRRRLLNVAVYLRTVLEPQLDGIGWETDLARLRRSGRRARTHLSLVENDEWLVIAVLNAVAGVCVTVLGILPAHLPVVDKAFLAAGVLLGNLGLGASARIVAWRLLPGHRGSTEAAHEKDWEDFAPPSLDAGLASTDGSTPGSDQDQDRTGVDLRLS